MLAESGSLLAKSSSVRAESRSVLAPRQQDHMSDDVSATALKRAVRDRKGVDIVQQLLDKGANPNCFDYKAAHKCGRGWDAGNDFNSCLVALAAP